MLIAILGAGAMGSLFGGRLGRAGHQLRLIDVNPAQVDAINRDGLWLEDDGGQSTVQAQAGTADRFAGPVDLLVVFTKSYHTVDALRSAVHLVGPETAVLSLQNGLGAAERMAQVLPDAVLLHGMTNWPADLVAPGRVSSHGEGEVRLWSVREEHADRAHAIATVLEGAGLGAVADPDVNVKIWEKVLFNAALNPLAALTRQTVGGMAAAADGPPLAMAALAEGVAVAHAAGVPVDHARVMAAIEHGFAHHGPHRPSMLHDVLAGRPTEIDAIAGEIIRIGASCGKSTPILETMTRLVRMIAR